MNAPSISPPPPSQPSSLLSLAISPKAVHLAIVALACAALAIRLIHLGPSRPLWPDECVASYIATAPTLKEAFARTVFDLNPPLHNAILRLVTGYSTHEIAFRVPSLVATLAGIIVLGATLARTVGKAAAAFLVVLLTFAQPFVFYAREARPYGLGVLALAVLLAAWIRLRRQPHRLWPFALAGVFAVVTAYQLWIVGAIAALWAATRWPAVLRQRGWQPALCAGLVAGIGGLIYWQFMPPHTEFRNSFLKPFFPPSHQPADLVWFTFRSTLDVARFALIGETPGPRWHLAGNIAGGILLASSAVGLIRSLRHDDERRDFHGLAWISLAVFAAIALRDVHPYGATRHCLPVALLLLVSAAVSWGEIAAAGRPALAAVAVASCALLAAAATLRVPTPSWYQCQTPQLVADLRNAPSPVTTIIAFDAAFFDLVHYSSPRDPWHASLVASDRGGHVRLAQLRPPVAAPGTTQAIVWEDCESAKMEAWVAANVPPVHRLAHYRRPGISAVVLTGVTIPLAF